jgi:hypothetical protein
MSSAHPASAELRERFELAAMSRKLPMGPSCAIVIPTRGWSCSLWNPNPVHSRFRDVEPQMPQDAS